MKKFKKLLSIALCFCIITVFCINANAFDPQEIVTSNDISGHPQIHGYTLTSNYTTNEVSQIRLNAYTWGTPVAGTPVTTWKNDNSSWIGYNKVDKKSKELLQ